jgi:hypothetical protein
MVRTEFPEVRAIATGENLGFGRGHNRAIAAGTGRALIVLNPDTIVLAGTFRRLVAFLDATADAGACGCTVLDAARALVPSGHRDHTLLSLAANVLNVRALLPSDAVLPSARAAGEVVAVDAKLLPDADEIARRFGHGPVLADPECHRAIGRLIGEQECLGSHRRQTDADRVEAELADLKRRLSRDGQ